ncbi:Crp/Fnr family transcriptional regulator [Pseudomonadota bacterium]
MNFPEILGDLKNTEEFPPQTVIFTEGDPADVLYVVLSGEVTLTLHGSVLGTEEEGGIIGEMAVLDAATRNSTATTTGPVRLARLDREQLRSLISGNSEFSMHVLAVLANRLRAVDQYISNRFDRG